MPKFAIWTEWGVGMGFLIIIFSFSFTSATAFLRQQLLTPRCWRYVSVSTFIALKFRIAEPVIFVQRTFCWLCFIVLGLPDSPPKAQEAHRTFTGKLISNKKSTQCCFGNTKVDNLSSSISSEIWRSALCHSAMWSR
jgi:hypothetical protein